MQEAIPYKTWASFPINDKTKANSNDHDHSTISTIKGARRLNDEDVRKMVSENAVIVFGSRGCCMTHVVNRLLQGQGVNPAVYEVDEKDEKNVIDQLQMIDAGKHEGLQFPVVYIGGQLFGGLDRIMATHITGELIPVLKQARALWL